MHWPFEYKSEYKSVYDFAGVVFFGDSLENVDVFLMFAECIRVIILTLDFLYSGSKCVKLSFKNANIHDILR